LHDEKWYYLLEEVERKFGLEEKKTEEVPHKHMTIETVTFTGASGQLKLERTTRAVVLERKVKFSKRIGGDSTEQYVYSDTEKTHRVVLYRRNEETRFWDEIDFRKLAREGG